MIHLSWTGSKAFEMHYILITSNPVLTHAWELVWMFTASKTWLFFCAEQVLCKFVTDTEGLGPFRLMTLENILVYVLCMLSEYFQNCMHIHISVGKKAEFWALFWHNDVMHRTDGMEFYSILFEAVVCFRHVDMTLILLLYTIKKVTESLIFFVQDEGYDFKSTRVN